MTALVFPFAQVAMQSRLNAQPIFPMDAPSDTLLAATLSVDSSHRSDRKRVCAIAGVAVASAGIVLPLAGEQAIAYEGPHDNPDVVQRAASRQQTAELMASAIAPQTSALGPASFSARSSRDNSSGAIASKPDSSVALSTAAGSTAAPLLARAQDGSLKLAYQPPTDASSGQTQALVAQLVSAAKGQPVSPPENAQATQPSVGDIVANSRTNSQLFAARQQVQQLQQKLADFEAARGQQNMAAYRNVLASRMAEIAEQKTQLDANIGQNQRLLTQLKMRLLSVDADVSLPDSVLGADEEYQAVWARLQKSEQDMQEEFSAANIDGTRLNEIYADYKYHQQWLAKVAEQAFPKYVMSDESAQVGFMSKSPVAIDIMQNLVVATHQDRVQQLRQSTLDTISQRLQSRHSQLTADIGEYEQLKRELSTATQVVAEYEQAETQQASGVKGQLVADRSSETAAPDAKGSAVSQAQLLAPYFANGTLSKTLLGIAIAAGALATAAVQRRNQRQKRSMRPELDALDLRSAASAAQLSPPSLPQPLEGFSIAPAAIETDFSAFSLYGESEAERSELEQDLLTTVLASVKSEVAEPISTDELMAELLEITRGDRALAAHRTGRVASQAVAEPALEAASAFRTEASLVSELSEIINGVSATTEQATMPALTAKSIEDILGVEVMAKELENIIKVAGPVLAPSRLLPARTALTDPIKLSVKEIDLFAEQVVRWVLNDLGFQLVNSSNLASEA